MNQRPESDKQIDVAIVQALTLCKDRESDDLDDDTDDRRCPELDASSFKREIPPVMTTRI